MKGERNKYTCSTCNGSIVTVDAEDGTTPMILRCRATPDCKGEMMSHWYRVDQTLTPQFELYKPDVREMRKFNLATRDHIERGGLLIRPLES